MTAVALEGIPAWGRLGELGRRPVAIEIGLYSTTIYKNTGFYVAGGVRESWISYGMPSATPPSGHALANVEWELLLTT